VLVPPAPVAPDRERWPRYEGTYLNVHRGRLATVRIRAGRLELEQNGQIRRLIAIAAGTYYYEDEDLRIPVEFLPEDGEEGGKDRRTEYLFVGGNPYRRAVLDADFRPDPASWERFVGAYHDPSNLGEGAVWRFRVDGGRLHVVGDWADEACVSLGPTVFLSGVGLLEFDADGQVLTVGKATRYHRTAGST
jgi:hypothetical protein